MGEAAESAQGGDLKAASQASAEESLEKASEALARRGETGVTPRLSKILRDLKAEQRPRKRPADPRTS